MGKPKPRNRTKDRSISTGKPAKGPSDPRILSALQDLQCADLKKKLFAASLIADLIKDPVTRKQLLREHIVKILIEQTLCDSNLETRTAGWKLLRDFAQEEEADFCVHLYRQDVIAAVEDVVKSIFLIVGSREAPFSSSPKAQQELIWNLIGSIVGLLSILSAAQDEILEAITEVPVLVNFPFGLLALESIPVELEFETLLCLSALTEDNKPLAEHILDNSFLLEGLKQIKDSGEAKAVPACSVLHNFFTAMQWYDHNTPMEGHSDAMILPALIQAMEVPQNNDTKGLSSSSSPDQVLQLAVEVIASIATCLQEALEHGIGHEKEFEGFGDDSIDIKQEMEHGVGSKDRKGKNMGSKDEDEDDEMDEDEESMNSEEIDADMDLVTGDGADDDDSPAEEVTLDRLVRKATPKLLNLFQSDGPIRSYALSALNNIAWTVSSIDFSTGHLNSLQKLWSSLSSRIWNEIITPVLSSNTADIDLASSVTSLAWALARSAQGVVEIQPGEHRKFMALYRASKTLNGPEQSGSTKGSEEPGDAFQGLGVKAIGVLGRLALSPAPIELNRDIGIFLLTVLADPNTSAADTVEAMNQIFDIYADKSNAFDEPVFWANGFYKHLEEILPKARKMAKGIDKRKFGELRARTDEAILNLARFLKYKRTERNGSN
ncbi:putative ARM repeat-containing [Hyphodiscus hymeniophilus]|uniref:ARM repeat-containing n=1 Tax=Hyphodiscus hymeniophilus TaxID=353542 RepID=A0A9P7B0E9_9HELO|nr:putative ARM repeat-containing [Hyphodiscus hymeniophilus]